MPYTTEIFVITVLDGDVLESCCAAILLKRKLICSRKSFVPS